MENLNEKDMNREQIIEAIADELIGISPIPDMPYITKENALRAAENVNKNRWDIATRIADRILSLQPVDEDELNELVRKYIESDEFILSFPYTFKRGFKTALSHLQPQESTQDEDFPTLDDSLATKMPDYKRKSGLEPTQK